MRAFARRTTILRIDAIPASLVDRNGVRMAALGKRVHGVFEAGARNQQLAQVDGM